MKDLILLHGALGSRRQFSALVQLLSPHFNVHTFNFEGHGDRASEKAFSMALFSKNLLDFLDKSGIESAHVFGYSMGGYVALHTAHKQPDRLRKIMTLGTKFNWTAETAAQETKMLNPTKIKEKVPSYALKLQAEHAPNDWEELLVKTAEMMLELGKGKGLKYNDLKQINHSVTIAIGSLDRMVSLQESEAAAKALPQGALWVAEGFKHPLERVNPQQLSEKIIDFFTE
jgi:pimeloyl-ACP methyl ester carboxylesterase